jgi:hypothetical protein
MSASDAPYEYIQTQNAFVAANVPLCSFRSSRGIFPRPLIPAQRRRSRSPRPRTSCTCPAASAPRSLTARSFPEESRRRLCVPSDDAQVEIVSSVQLQVCQNLLAVAEAAGADKAGIVKCNSVSSPLSHSLSSLPTICAVYLKDMNDFGAVNKVYGPSIQHVQCVIRAFTTRYRRLLRPAQACTDLRRGRTSSYGRARRDRGHRRCAGMRRNGTYAMHATTSFDGYHKTSIFRHPSG